MSAAFTTLKGRLFDTLDLCSACLQETQEGLLSCVVDISIP